MKQYNDDGRRIPDEFDDQQYLERVKANPDLLRENQGYGYQPGLSDNQRLMLKATREAKLTSQQRLMVYLCGERLMTIERAGREIGITKSAAQSALEAARVKIIKRYSEIKRERTNEE